MRKLFPLVLCLLFLCPTARAAGSQRQYIALILEDEPPGFQAQELLDGLSDRQARVTFFLSGITLEHAPDLARQILDRGHEIGLRGCTLGSMAPMSRRAIAGELNGEIALLPPGCPIRFFRPPEGITTDGVHQVARALGLCMVESAGDGTENENSVRFLSPLGRVRDGDILLSEQETLLELVDLLQHQGYTLVTLSELTALRQARLKPGTTYRGFPPGM